MPSKMLWYFCVSMLIVLCFIKQSYAYSSIEWVGYSSSTGEFEWESLDEVKGAVEWSLWKQLPYVQDYVPRAALSLDASGKVSLDLAYTASQEQMQDALLYWLGNFWFKKNTGEAAQFKVLSVKKNGYDATGVYHFRVYYEVVNPPIVKR